MTPSSYVKQRQDRAISCSDRWIDVRCINSTKYERDGLHKSSILPHCSAPGQGRQRLSVGTKSKRGRDKLDQRFGTASRGWPNPASRAYRQKGSLLLSKQRFSSERPCKALSRAWRWPTISIAKRLVTCRTAGTRAQEGITR